MPKRMSKSGSRDDGLEILDVGVVLEDGDRIRSACLYVRGELVSMPRPRLNHRGGIYLPARYQRFRAQLRAMFDSGKLAGLDWGTGPYRLVVEVWKPFGLETKRYGDIDNLAKSVMDALPFDDSLVAELVVTKYQSDEMKFRVIISRADTIP
jgi:Holliday junction resolvase RusA-like endonuclease